MKQRFLSWILFQNLSFNRNMAAKGPVSNLRLGALVALADLHEFELPIKLHNIPTSSNINVNIHQ